MQHLHAGEALEQLARKVLHRAPFPPARHRTRRSARSSFRGCTARSRRKGGRGWHDLCQMRGQDAGADIERTVASETAARNICMMFSGGRRLAGSPRIVADFRRQDFRPPGFSPSAR
jgi:hypothetical protein